MVEVTRTIMHQHKIKHNKKGGLKSASEHTQSAPPRPDCLPRVWLRLGTNYLSVEAPEVVLISNNEEGCNLVVLFWEQGQLNNM